MCSRIDRQAMKFMKGLKIDKVFFPKWSCALNADLFELNQRAELIF